MVLQESEILELKKSTAELKEAVISIGAILNKHQGGLLYFGVKNDGTPRSVRRSVIKPSATSRRPLPTTLSRRSTRKSNR
ncbi:MAG: RNA-binding domain-containing protein [Phycisphaerae bacterium]